MRRIMWLMLAAAVLVPEPVSALKREGDEFAINTYTTNNQINPDVAGLADGGFVVVWESYGQDGSLFGVYGRLFDDAGEAVDDEFAITDYTTRAQRHPDVAGLRDGSFVVVWQSNERDGSGYGIFGQVFDSDGFALDLEDFQVNSYTTDAQTYPRVAPLPDGFVVVWQSNAQEGGDQEIWGQRFDIDAARVGSEFHVNSYTTGSQRNAVVTSDFQGRFAVLWTSDPANGTGEDGSEAGIFARRYSASGAAVGPQFQVNAITTNDQVRPAAVPWGEGGFLAVWESRSLEKGAESTDGAAARACENDGTLVGSAEFQVNQYTTSFQEDVDIAAVPGGEMFVLWESHGGSSGGVTPAEPLDGVFARALNPAGGAIGEDFQVNTYTTNAQQDASVAALADARYVVVWESDGQDGSFGGIFGQLYSTVICADANGDGRLAVSDALLILRASVGLGTCNACVCDADGSGKVAAADALVSLRGAVGIYTDLACTGC